MNKDAKLGELLNGLSNVYRYSFPNADASFCTYLFKFPRDIRSNWWQPVAIIERK